MLELRAAFINDCPTANARGELKVEPSHHHGKPASGHAHGHDAPPASGHGPSHGSLQDWNDEDFVANWLERQQTRSAERRRQFVVMRAVLPKTAEQEFRYINLGAGPGNLDEVLLEQFPNAQATLVDASLAMLSVARQRLERFGNRVEYVQANLERPDWTGAIGGSFDVAVSSHAVHHLGDARRIRAIYTEIYRMLGHGGMFLNLDMVRPARPSLAPLAPWAAKDPEAGLAGREGDPGLPGTMLEHLGWLSEAGFGNVDVVWKNMNTALFCAIRDHLHLPAGGDGHAKAEAHGHAH